MHTILAQQGIPGHVRLRLLADLSQADLDISQGYDDFMYQVCGCLEALQAATTQSNRTQSLRVQVYARACDSKRQAETVIARICATLQHIRFPLYPPPSQHNTMHAALAFMTITDINLYVEDVYHNQRKYEAAVRTACSRSSLSFCVNQHQHG